MNMKGGFIMDFLKEALFEHRFWLQILGDHSRFIYHTLSPSEIEKIQRAAYFIISFDELLMEARRNLNADEVMELTQRANIQANNIREFKLELLREHLVGNIIIQLSPTFLNHTVNEVEEYLRTIQFLLVNKIPTAHPIHYHHLWLKDATGHAAAIYCELDEVEKELRNISNEFIMNFSDLYNKADEFSGYLRTCLQDFPALHRLNNQVDNKMKLFMGFLNEVLELRLSKRAVGTLMPLIPDHMFREECYYLIKLAQVTELNMPDCDPTRPRIEVS